MSDRMSDPDCGERVRATEANGHHGGGCPVSAERSKAKAVLGLLPRLPEQGKIQSAFRQVPARRVRRRGSLVPRFQCFTTHVFTRYLSDVLSGYWKRPIFLGWRARNPGCRRRPLRSATVNHSGTDRSERPASAAAATKIRRCGAQSIPSNPWGEYALGVPPLYPQRRFDRSLKIV